MNGFNDNHLEGEIYMFGLGKKRSKLGSWLDSKGISQQWLSKTSNVSRSTISDLCNGNGDHSPNQSTMKKVLKAIRKVDPTAKVDDFFDV